MDQPLPAKLLYAWPMPDVVGLQLDPREKATVRHVVPGSPAERADFQPGDEIPVTVLRRGETIELNLTVD